MNSAYIVISQFEQALCDYCGSKYAVTVNSCSMAMFLCCKYVDVSKYEEITIPNITYPSAAASIVNAGGRIKFSNINWQKNGMIYELSPTKIYDAAKVMKKNMYIPESFMCLSFHSKKIINIGRGGAILTDRPNAYKWFKCARFDGRHECSLESDRLEMPGWNCYMPGYDAARGLELMQWIGEENYCEEDPYQDLSRYKFFTQANR